MDLSSTEERSKEGEVRMLASDSGESERKKKKMAKVPKMRVGRPAAKRRVSKLFFLAYAFDSSVGSAFSCSDFVTLIPSGVSSKAQARIIATGKKQSNMITTKR